MRKSIFAAALAGVLIWAGVASAGPLAPNLATNGAIFVGPDAHLCGLFSCIAGEGAAPNFQRSQTVGGTFIGPGAVQHSDWIVIYDPAGAIIGTNGSALASDDDYLYMYQIENSSVFALSTFLIGGPANPPSPFGFKAGTEGFLSGKDLDLNADTPGGAGHNMGSFANLGDPSMSHSPFPAVNETEKTGAGADLVCCQDPNSVLVSSLFVTFGSPAPILGATALLEVGEESSILFVRGTRPTYGDWVTSGASGGTMSTVVAWGSSNQNHCNIGVTTMFDAGFNAMNDPDCAHVLDSMGSVVDFSMDELGVSIPVPTTPVPEPASLLLLGSGLAGLGFWARRRQQ